MNNFVSFNSTIGATTSLAVVVAARAFPGKKITESGTEYGIRPRENKIRTKNPPSEWSRQCALNI